RMHTAAGFPANGLLVKASTCVMAMPIFYPVELEGSVTVVQRGSRQIRLTHSAGSEASQPSTRLSIASATLVFFDMSMTPGAPSSCAADAVRKSIEGSARTTPLTVARLRFASARNLIFTVVWQTPLYGRAQAFAKALQAADGPGQIRPTPFPLPPNTRPQWADLTHKRGWLHTPGRGSKTDNSAGLIPPPLRAGRHRQWSPAIHAYR